MAQRKIENVYAKQLRGKKRADALDKRHGGTLPDSLKVTRYMATNALKGDWSRTNY